MIKSRENTIGAWAFLTGVILAVLIGLSARMISIPTLTKYSAQMYAMLLVLGLIVGYINSNGKDPQTFLIAGAVLIIASKFGMDAVTGSLIGFPIAETVKTVFSALLTLFVPATIVVSLKTVFSIAKL
jgi:hypothetical protein